MHAINCPSEQEISLQRQNDANAQWTLVVTRWVDIGKCEHTGDLQFRSLVSPYNAARLLGEPDIPYTFDIGSYRQTNPRPIRLRFEQGQASEDHRQEGSFLLPYFSTTELALRELRIFVAERFQPDSSSTAQTSSLAAVSTQNFTSP